MRARGGEGLAETDLRSQISSDFSYVTEIPIHAILAMEGTRTQHERWTQCYQQGYPPIHPPQEKRTGKGDAERC